MNADTPTCACKDHEGRECAGSPAASRRALRNLAGWLLLATLAGAAFMLVTLGRAAVSRAHEPLALAALFVAVGIGGGAIGLRLAAWLHARRSSAHSEAGDTHAGFVNTQRLPQADRLACAGQFPARRVRAGRVPLPYSYDGRKKDSQA